MVHFTKQKGDLAVAKTIADLTSKEYAILTPTISEHLRFDLVAYKDTKFTRIQCKYSINGFIMNGTSWNDKNGNHKRMYEESDFDYYAIYLPDIDEVVYPSIKFSGCTIRSTIPNSPTPFYWWKDFIQFTDTTNKKTYKEFEYVLSNQGQFKPGVEQPWNHGRPPKELSEMKSNNGPGGWNKGLELPQFRKVVRPSKEELEKLLWEKPTSQIAIDFGVSDKAIEKWAKTYGIAKPPRGYWTTSRTSTHIS